MRGHGQVAREFRIVLRERYIRRIGLVIDHQTSDASVGRPLRSACKALGARSQAVRRDVVLQAARHVHGEVQFKVWLDLSLWIQRASERPVVEKATAIKIYTSYGCPLRAKERHVITDMPCVHPPPGLPSRNSRGKRCGRRQKPYGYPRRHGMIASE